MPRAQGARKTSPRPELRSEKTGFDWTEVSVPVLEEASFVDDRMDARQAVALPLGTELGEEMARKTLERRISAHLESGRLALGITDNRFTMISVRRYRGPVYRVRLHH